MNSFNIISIQLKERERERDKGLIYFDDEFVRFRYLAIQLNNNISSLLFIIKRINDKNDLGSEG